jgi:hypothetical protein
MSQRFLTYVGPKHQLQVLSNRLVEAGFRVGPDRTSSIQVRVRTDSDDEAKVEDIATQVAPDSRRGPNSTPSTHLRNYREGL